MGSNFWKDQPVGRNIQDGVVDDSKNKSNVVTKLPDGLYWDKIDNIEKITSFLRKYYVEDISSSYRLSYSDDFIDFLLKYPLHKPEYSLGLFKDNKMVGYILGREHLVSIQGKNTKMLSVNFLCLNKKHRCMNLAPLLIEELRRIANQNNIFQAVFTSERNYGFSFCSANYFHYPLNIENLIAVELLSKDHKKTKPLALDDETRIATQQDLQSVYQLYKQMVEKSTIFEIFDEDSFVYTFQNRADVIRTVYNEKRNEFASFYIVNTYCIEKNAEIKRAYLYYWAGSSQIILDTLCIAIYLGIDMFDLVNISGNNKIIKELGFSEGTGSLKYHFFNYEKTPISSSKINFILF